jgi:hypothetical protein
MRLSRASDLAIRNYLRLASEVFRRNGVHILMSVFLLCTIKTVLIRFLPLSLKAAVSFTWININETFHAMQSRCRDNEISRYGIPAHFIVCCMTQSAGSITCCDKKTTEIL